MSADKQKKGIAEFFRREKNRLVGYVRRLVQDTTDRDGEDIVQDVMLHIFDSADITGPIENLSAYIYRSLYNRVVDSFRKRRYTLSLDESIDTDEKLTLMDVLSDLRYDAHTELEKKEVHNHVYDAIDTLNPDQREIFIATEFEGRSFRELSVEWDIPINTLLSRKFRAVQNIRSALKNLMLEGKER